jgi:hypothetical protein
MIVASAAIISDSVEFVNGDGLTNKIISEIDGQAGVIRDEVMQQTSGMVINL